MVPGLMTITFAHFSGVPDLKMPEPFSPVQLQFLSWQTAYAPIPLLFPAMCLKYRKRISNPPAQPTGAAIQIPR